MATMDASQITLGSAKGTGAIYVAPKGTTLPTDATTNLSGTFKLLGFTSDAGVQIGESSASQSISAWEGNQVVINVRESYAETITFTPIQCNADVAKLIWGDSNVTVGTGGALTIKHTGDILDPVAIVIETVPRSGIVRRQCGVFQLTERGAQTLDGKNPDGRQLTFTSVEDSDGTTMTEYIAFTATTTTTGA